MSKKKETKKPGKKKKGLGFSSEIPKQGKEARGGLIGTKLNAN